MLPQLTDARSDLTQRLFALTFFAELIAYQPALDALGALGYAYPKFSDGYVISKPPQSPQLFWHNDWFTWEDPRSYEPEPMQLFLMYYLTDTTPENGCLRVVPGSHRRHNALHDVLAAPHSRELAAAHHMSRAEFSRRPDEVDVPVHAGDLLIGDARILHAAHPNQAMNRRTLLTLWYQPDLASLPERMQAQLAKKTHVPPKPGRRQQSIVLLPYWQAILELLSHMPVAYTGARASIRDHRFVEVKHYCH